MSIDELVKEANLKSAAMTPEEFRDFLDISVDEYIKEYMDIPKEIEDQKIFIVDSILKNEWIKKNLKKINRKNPWK